LIDHHGFKRTIPVAWSRRRRVEEETNATAEYLLESDSKTINIPGGKWSIFPQLSKTGYSTLISFRNEYMGTEPSFDEVHTFQGVGQFCPPAHIFVSAFEFILEAAPR
jgi:hypothetical protein